jgi:hypothetical protein
MNPNDVLMGAYRRVVSPKVSEPKKSTGHAISQLIERAFATRNLTHFAHWASDSYSQHEALGDIYETIVEKIDEVVEVYQGKFGIIQGLSSIGGRLPADIIKHIEAESAWLTKNKTKIANGCDAVSALLDELEACYLKAIYKLKNLK